MKIWSFSQGKYTLAQTKSGVFYLASGRNEIKGSVPYPLLTQALREGWMTYPEVLEIADVLKLNKLFVEEIEECMNSSEQ